MEFCACYNEVCGIIFLLIFCESLVPCIMYTMYCVSVATPPSDSSGVGGIVGGVVSSISAILVVVVVAVVVTICIKKKKKNTVPTCNTNGRRSPEARHQPGGYEESTQQQNLPDSQPPQIQPLPYPANNPPPFNPDASYPPSAPPSGAWGPNFDEEPPPYPCLLYTSDAADE